MANFTYTGNPIARNIVESMIVTDGWIDRAPTVITSPTLGLSNFKYNAAGIKFVVDSAGIMSNTVFIRGNSYWFWFDVTLSTQNVDLIITNSAVPPKQQMSANGDGVVLIGSFVNNIFNTQRCNLRPGIQLGQTFNFPIGAVVLLQDPSNINFYSGTWTRLPGGRIFRNLNPDGTAGMPSDWSTTGTAWSTPNTSGIAADIGILSQTSGSTTLTTNQIPAHTHNSINDQHRHFHGISHTHTHTHDHAWGHSGHGGLSNHVRTTGTISTWWLGATTPVRNHWVPTAGTAAGNIWIKRDTIGRSPNTANGDLNVHMTNSDGSFTSGNTTPGATSSSGSTGVSIAGDTLITTSTNGGGTNTGHTHVIRSNYLAVYAFRRTA